MASSEPPAASSKHTESQIIKDDSGGEKAMSKTKIPVQLVSNVNRRGKRRDYYSEEQEVSQSFHKRLLQGLEKNQQTRKINKDKVVHAVSARGARLGTEASNIEYVDVAS